MASEAESWAIYRPLIASLDPVRIENSIGLGFPDVNYTFGWIENKHLHSWPKRDTTHVKIDHFTVEQRGWAVRRAYAGGLVFMMLHVSSANEWCLLDGGVAARVIGKVTTKSLRGLCRYNCVGIPEPRILIPILKGQK